MAMALALESTAAAAASPAFMLGIGIGMAAEQPDDLQEQQEVSIEEEMGLGLDEDEQQHKESSLFGPVHRQKRRQDIPRARRRCFPSFVADEAATPSRDPWSGSHDSVIASRCSFRTLDEETAICSTVVQSADPRSHLRRDCMDTPVSRSPADSVNLSEDGDSSLSCPSWTPGQLVWAKFSRSPWWPAQVVDDRTVGASTRAHRQSEVHVLVRFFGNYNYGWVDPVSNLSKFDMNFHERSQVVTKAFQKGLKEALEYRDFRKVPLKWRNSSHEECQTPNVNGKESSEDTGSEALESERTTSARRRKPKMLYEEEERLHQKPKRNLRRKRIMRELGLCAPYGSPFTFNTIGTNF